MKKKNDGKKEVLQAWTGDGDKNNNNANTNEPDDESWMLNSLLPWKKLGNDIILDETFDGIE